MMEATDPQPAMAFLGRLGEALAHLGLALGPAGSAVLALCVGFALGIVHFGSLWWNARLYAGGGALKAFAIQVARFALLVAVFVALARLGALALVAGALGLVAARAVLVRRLGRAPREDAP